MKKIFNMMMAVAIAAFTFTACEDVPEPYNNPYNGAKIEEPVVIDPAGSGTKDDPWNVAALIEKTTAAGLADGAFLNDGAEVYVKGIVTETTEVSVQYGNATYYISDDAKGSNRFYVFRGKLVDGASVTAETDLQVGDTVVVCGKVKNYKGTLEFDQGNYLVSLVKGDGSETPSKSDVKEVGSKDAPKTVAEALTAINAMEDGATSEEFWFVKGKVVKVTTTQANFDQYKNLNYLISEDGTENNTITVYAGNGLDNAQFTGVDALKAGDEVVVYGQIQKYVNKSGAMTPEIAKGNYLVSINSGSNTPDTKTVGTKDAPKSIAEALAAINALADGATSEEFWFVKGKVVKVTTNQANFEKYGNLNYLISEDGTENNTITVYSGDGLNGDKFSGIDALKPGDEVVVYGQILKYVKNDNVTPEIAKGNYLVSINSGSNTPDTKTVGTKDAPKSIAEALAAINALADGAISEEFWFVKGKVVKVTTNQANFEKYGNLNYLISEDGTENNTITVYSGDGLNGDKFSGIDALKSGDEVVVYGQIQKYVKNNNVTPEIAKGNYLVSLNGNKGNSQSGNQGSDASAGSASINFTAQGYKNAQEVTSATITEGTTITFEAGENTNTPKYYDSGSAIRMYPKNFFTINANKTISSITMVCSANNAEGNISASAGTVNTDNMTITISDIKAKSVKVTNTHTGTGAVSQLRISSLTVNYAQ